MIIASLDLETTGLIEPEAPAEYQPRITEIGCVVFENGSSETFSTFVHPEIDIPAEVQKITGITLEMVKDAPNFREAFKEFSKFMTGVDKLITFNGPGYDLPVLMFNLKRYNLQYQFPWPRLHLDLMTASSDYLGMQGKTGNKNPKLTELYKFLFDEDFPAHRALNDAEATLRCAKELAKRKVIEL